MTSSISQVNLIDVAVAVLYYQPNYQTSEEVTAEFLLGYRHAGQHQGERYEFVGGKVEANETSIQALIREVDEEIGIKIDAVNCQLMGIIEHDYTDKQVRLHTYSVMLSQQQYQYLKEQSTGKLGQKIVWVKKASLVAQEYPLPEANQQILSWIGHW